MYWLIRNLPWQRLFKEQSPPLLGSFVVAEAFYKFHSFTLECGAFLLTWAAFDAAYTEVRLRLRTERKQD
jgi:hypothetical protein